VNELFSKDIKIKRNTKKWLFKIDELRGSKEKCK
jgi:hypothetical protein